MTKKKKSKKRDFYWKDIPNLKPKNMDDFTRFEAKKMLSDKKHISEALWQCLQDGDTKAFKKILKVHLEVTNKVALSEAIDIPRRTLYRMLSPEGNPSLENVTKIIHKLCA
jgi:probable addiction module antidote protein